MCILDNFIEDELFHNQLIAEYEYKAWCDYVEQKEQEENDYLLQAEQYFKDLEQYEKTII